MTYVETLHCEFLDNWNTQKRIWQHFSCLLNEEIPKIWATYKIAQPIQPIWQHIFALPWSALKKPLWEFNFFHIFGIPSSSRHEKHCQMLQTLFWLFQCSKNSRCYYCEIHKRIPLKNQMKYIFFWKSCCVI